MPRFVMKFSKKGYTKYISHLDLLRVFKRAFKVMGLDIKYSQGFNPHPKMGFAQPLSLGYSSVAEYLEFETVGEHDPDEIKTLFTGKLPEDVKILDLFRFDQEVKSLAAETVACRYLISVPVASDMDLESLEALLDGYLSQESIRAMKRMKKTKSIEEVEIKDKIRDIKVRLEDGNAVFDCLLDSGSQSNLSPEQVISSFLQYSGWTIERWDIEVERTEILYSDRIRFRHIDNPL